MNVFGWLPKLPRVRSGTFAASGTSRSVPLPAAATGRVLVPRPERTADRRRPWRPGTRLARVPWPLLAVLAVQAAFSLRLAWSNTAFQDEGLYLWAGHLEIAHWLHDTAIPAFPAFLSGSPVLYPPLGALADSIGGLAAARILSLGLMLTATSMLWSTVSRLYGRRAAFFGCAVFARWSSTHSIRLLDGHSINPRNGSSLGPSSYLGRIREGFFSVVILDFGPTAALDASLTEALEHNYHYHLAAEVPYGRGEAAVWEYQPQRHFSSAVPGPRPPVRPAAQGLLTPVARPGPVLGPIVLAATITGILTLVLTLCMRFAWRRRKASDDI